MDYQIIKPQKIENLMFNDGKYIVEFCEAGLSSYEEFIENYEKYLRDRNIEELKKAAHKVKPGLQMMGAEIVLEEYEYAKELIETEAGEDQIDGSIRKMTDLCRGIIKELQFLADKY